MKKIFIAGAGGMLGEAFKNVFSKDFKLLCTDIDVNEDWLEYLDFRDSKEYQKQVINFKPDYLFHLGAHTGLEYCDTNESDAYITNTLSVETATQLANDLNIPILYISTAGIFDGKKKKYDDWDDPNPLGVYARSKYIAEKFVVSHADQYLIMRAGWMMGGGRRKDKKFIGKLISQIEDGAKELNIVNDKDGTPTYTYDFAETAKQLIKNNHRGLFNCVCEGETSRLEVAHELINCLELNNKVQINEVGSEFFSKEYFSERPPSERLVNKKLNLIGIDQMRPWQEALKVYINKDFRD